MEKVAKYRKKLHLSQREMADILGISMNSYSNKERAVTQFKLEEMKKFHKTVSDIFPDVKLSDIFY